MTSAAFFCNPYDNKSHQTQQDGKTVGIKMYLEPEPVLIQAQCRILTTTDEGRSDRTWRQDQPCRNHQRHVKNLEAVGSHDEICGGKRLM
jgi:hypothetical protein